MNFMRTLTMKYWGCFLDTLQLVKSLNISGKINNATVENNANQSGVTPEQPSPSIAAATEGACQTLGPLWSYCEVTCARGTATANEHQYKSLTVLEQCIKQQLCFVSHTHESHKVRRQWKNGGSKRRVSLSSSLISDGQQDPEVGRKLTAACESTQGPEEVEKHASTWPPAHSDILVEILTMTHVAAPLGTSC